MKSNSKSRSKSKSKSRSKSNSSNSIILWIILTVLVTIFSLFFYYFLYSKNITLQIGMDQPSGQNNILRQLSINANVPENTILHVDKILLNNDDNFERIVDKNITIKEIRDNVAEIDFSSLQKINQLRILVDSVKIDGKEYANSKKPIVLKINFNGLVVDQNSKISFDVKSDFLTLTNQKLVVNPVISNVKVNKK